MKKISLLIGLVVVSAVAGGSFAYGWHSVANSPGDDMPSERPQATANTPPDAEPYTLLDIDPTIRSESLTSQHPVEQQLPSVASENGQIILTLDEIQLNQLVAEAIDSQPQAAQLFANVRSLKTTLKDDFIETGAILNLSELPRDGLPTEVQTALEQLTSAVPMLANRDIYIGIVAQPQAQDGQITLNQDLNIKFGQFTLPLADVAERMEISIGSLEQRLNTMLHQQGLVLENIQILDNQLVITGTKS